MIINHNIAALNTYRQLSINNSLAAKSLEKLSSGLRINRAGDDAAGLAISEKMRAQIRGLNQASRNAQDVISLIQTAEGALNEVHAILQRMRELAVQASNDSATADDREKIQAEVDQLAKEITRISNTSEFNTQNLLAGGLNATFHIGANEGQNISLSISAMDAYSLGVAGNAVQAVNFNAGTTNLTGISNISRGIATSDVSGYQIVVDKTEAALKTGSFARTGGSGTTDLTSGIVDATGYTGTQDATYLIQITGVDDAGSNTNNRVTQIKYSKDGGTSWVTVDTTVNATNNGTTATFDGITLTFDDGTSDGAYATDDSYTFAVTAAKATLQLKDNNSATVGSAVTVYYGATSAELGLAKENKAVTVTFDFDDLASGTATFDIDVTESSAAVTREGKVISEAVAQNGIDVSTQKAASSAITVINNAITKVSEERSKLGAYQNRLEHTINNLGTASENLSAAESRIRDIDMAKEMMEFTKMNILQQAATAMLSQANQQPQLVLQLLR